MRCAVQLLLNYRAHSGNDSEINLQTLVEGVSPLLAEIGRATCSPAGQSSRP